MATHQWPVFFSAPDALGNAYPALVDFAPNRQIVPAFVKDVDGTWYGHIRVPQNYVGNAKVIVSIFANATTGVTRLVLGTFKAANAATYDAAAFTDETAQDITVPATVNVRKDVTFPASGSLATSLAAGDDLFIRLQHVGTAGTDTLAVDTMIMEAVFQYTDV